MKALLALVVASRLLGGCSVQVDSRRPAPRARRGQRGAAAGRRQRRADRADAVSRRRVHGTVEQLARAACLRRAGRRPDHRAGPVEVYRMQCDDGKVFMARCELRQCRKM
jgi:hypothetical protein